MSDSRDREAAVDRWLHRTSAAAADLNVTAACPDAEQMAAWADGGLSGEARTSVEAHLASCARCQAVAGTLARTESIVQWATPERRSPWRWLTWAIPLTAAATIAMVIVVDRRSQSTLSQRRADVPPVAEARRGNPSPTAPAERAELKDQAPPTRERPGAAAEPANAQKRSSDQARAENEKANASRATDSLSAPARSAPPPATPPASTVQPAPRQALEQKAAAAQAKAEESDRRLARADEGAVIEIRSPDPAVRWRVIGTQVQRSIDAGTTWTASPTPPPAGITAGSAPSASVCWLVGRGGLVLLSIDGLRWEATTSPATTDLSAIRATDARNATVTTTDGREFSTTDGGRTWVRRDLQEIPTAPF